MVVVDRRLEPRTPALGHLAAPVGRHRLEQPPYKVRMPLRHGVVHRHRTGQRRQPARSSPSSGTAARRCRRNRCGSSAARWSGRYGRSDPWTTSRGHGRGRARGPSHSAIGRCRNTCRYPNRPWRFLRSFCPQPAAREAARSRGRSARHRAADPGWDRVPAAGSRHARSSRYHGQAHWQSPSRSRLSRWATADRSIRPGASPGQRRSMPIGPVTKGRRVCWSTALDIVPPVR